MQVSRQKNYIDKKTTCEKIKISIQKMFIYGWNVFARK